MQHFEKAKFWVEKRVEFSNGSHTTSAELGRNRDKCPFVTLASRVLSEVLQKAEEVSEVKC